MEGVGDWRSNFSMFITKASLAESSLEIPAKVAFSEIKVLKRFKHLFSKSEKTTLPSALNAAGTEYMKVSRSKEIALFLGFHLPFEPIVPPLLHPSLGC